MNVCENESTGSKSIACSKHVWISKMRLRWFSISGFGLAASKLLSIQGQLEIRECGVCVRLNGKYISLKSGIYFVISMLELKVSVLIS